MLKFNSNGDVNLKSIKSDAVCLPSSGDTPAHGTRCWSAGWGLMRVPDRRELATELQEVDLQAAVFFLIPTFFSFFYDKTIKFFLSTVLLENKQLWLFN